MDNEVIKCPTCKRKIHHLNKEGLLVTKNCSVLETDPKTGVTSAICRSCKTRVLLNNFRVVMEPAMKVEVA